MTDRIKVQPVYSAWGTIQGWAIKRANRELGFFTSRITALNVATCNHDGIYLDASIVDGLAITIATCNECDEFLSAGFDTRMMELPRRVVDYHGIPVVKHRWIIGWDESSTGVVE